MKRTWKNYQPPQADCVCCGTAFRKRRPGNRFCSKRCAGLMQVRRVTPLAERFWRKVQKSKFCWEWLGARDPAG
jgi:hypothetical protein